MTEIDPARKRGGGGEEAATGRRNPSFVQSLSLFKWVSRAKQSLPVISLEIPVRPSVVDKNQTLRNLVGRTPTQNQTT